MNVKNQVLPLLMLIATVTISLGQTAFINVKNHGVLGDNSANDWDSIQAVINNVGSLGATIYFPPGIYLVDEPIILRCKCNMVGDRTTIKKYSSFTGNRLLNVKRDSLWIKSLNLNFDNTGYALYAMDTVDSQTVNIEISNLTITTKATGIYVAYILSDVTIANNRITNTNASNAERGIGINVDAVNHGVNIRIRNNTITGFGKFGFDNNSVGQALKSRFIGNQITGLTGTSELGYGARLYHFHGVIANNSFDSNKRGVFLDGDGDDIVVDNNVIMNNSWYGASFEEFDGTFSNNYVVNNGSSGADFSDELGADSIIPEGGAGLVLGSVRRATFVGNTIHANYGVGVYVNRKATTVNAYPLSFIITGNSIVNNGHDGIWLDDNFGRYLEISDNIVADNGTNASSVASSIYAGIRVTSTPVGHGRLWINGNVFSSQSLTGGYGTDGKQRHGIISRDTSGSQVYSTPVLIAKDNVFEIPNESGAYAIRWKYGTKYILNNVFRGDSILFDIGYGTAVIHGNKGALESYTTDDDWDVSGTDLVLNSAITGNVGIGTTSPGSKLDVRGDAVFNEDGDDKDFRVEGDTESDLFFVDASTDRVGIGTNAPSTDLTITNGSTSVGLNMISYRSSNATHGIIDFRSGRGTEAAPSAVSNGDELGRWIVRGHDGTDNLSAAAEIKINVDATTGSNDMPGRITFSTTSDGASAVTNRMIINSSGHTLPGADKLYDLGASGTRWNNLYVYNAPTVGSDRRFKTNIRSSQYGLDEILQLNPVLYKLKLHQPVDSLGNPKGVPVAPPRTDNIGFIAQELQAVISEVVHVGDDPDQSLGVRYSELIPVLTSAIQELAGHDDALELENEELKNELETLEEKDIQLEQDNEDLKRDLDALSLEVEEMKENLDICCDAKQSDSNIDHGTVHWAYLFQNVPNPFSQESKLGYLVENITSHTSIFIIIYDLTGKQLKHFEISNSKDEGSIIIEAGQFYPGTFIYTLFVDGQTIDSKKMVLIE